jgi:glutaredoxin
MTDVTVYSKDDCPYCVKAKTVLSLRNIKFTEKKIGVDVTREQLLEAIPNARTVPQIVINGDSIGGYEQLLKYIEETNFNGTGETL